MFRRYLIPLEEQFNLLSLLVQFCGVQRVFIAELLVRDRETLIVILERIPDSASRTFFSLVHGLRKVPLDWPVKLMRAYRHFFY